MLPSSCHPSNITKNIPYSLAYRLVRICTERHTLLKRLSELKDLLISRNYNSKLIDSAIERALSVSREESLKRVVKKRTDRVIFSLKYHPALPPVNRIVFKAWNTMVKNPYLKEIFPKPPMVAYKRPQSLRDILVKAKLPQPSSKRPKRNSNGMKKCLNCNICPYVSCYSVIKSSVDNSPVNISSTVDCNTRNVIYLIDCLKCKNQYIGQTGRSFKERIREHLGYIRNNKISEPTGLHFNLPGHNISMFKASIIEKCKFDSRMYRETREEWYIQKFQTKFKGMNRKL